MIVIFAVDVTCIYIIKLCQIDLAVTYCPRGEVTHLEREIDSLKRAVDNERKKADGLIRERDLLNKLKTQAEHATHKQIDLIKINENTKRNLEQEMNGYKAEAQKQAKVGMYDDDTRLPALQTSRSGHKTSYASTPSFPIKCILSHAL